jgi:hypothetical protein
VIGPRLAEVVAALAAAAPIEHPPADRQAGVRFGEEAGGVARIGVLRHRGSRAGRAGRGGEPEFLGVGADRLGAVPHDLHDRVLHHRVPPPIDQHPRGGGELRCLPVLHDRVARHGERVNVPSREQGLAFQVGARRCHTSTAAGLSQSGGVTSAAGGTGSWRLIRLDLSPRRSFSSVGAGRGPRLPIATPGSQFGLCSGDRTRSYEEVTSEE